MDVSPRVLKKAEHSNRKVLSVKDDIQFRGVNPSASVRFAPLCPVRERLPVLQNIRVVLVNTSHPGNIGGG
ncbi:hypothetical protein, partial [Pseudomonas gingeri]|uniref:hypothetical protein n=1 Tax=Pseudomonas gingeri TaxID=117681 RepID=UPI001FD830CA